MQQYPTAYPYPPQNVRPPRPRRLVRRRRGCLIPSCLLLIALPLTCVGAFLIAFILFPPTPTTIVLLGVDARPGQGYLTRTDSIMLLNIAPGRAHVALLSIPRDVFIDVPGYGAQRINTINVLGEQDAPGTGPDLIKASLQQSFGVETDYYVRLDFDAFIELVDAVGGVDIDVPYVVEDWEYPTMQGGTEHIRFEPGRQHMDGETALKYARTRHQDDDYRRAERQQQVVDAVIHKLTNPLQVVRWPQVLSALQSHIDTDMNVIDLLRLSPGLVLGWSGHASMVLDRDYLYVTDGGYAVPDYAEIQPWIDQNFN